MATKAKRTVGVQPERHEVVQPTIACDVPEIRLRMDDVLPPLSEEEYEALKESIRIHGVQIPVETDSDGYPLDGNARVRACRELGITDFPVIVRLNLTEDEKRDHRLRVNCQRRQFSQTQIGELIEAELVRDPHRGNPTIAELCGSTTPTVRRHRLLLQSADLIPVVDTVVSRNGQIQPAQKPRKPAVLAPTADGVAEVLGSVSQVEACDLSGRLYTNTEMARIASDQKQRREHRADQIAGDNSEASGETNDAPDSDDGTPDDDGESESDDEDPGHVRLMLVDTTVPGAPTYAEIADTAAVVLKWGTPVAVRVPTADAAEAFRVLGENLEYTSIFVEVLPEPIPVALPIPVEQRHRLTIIFRQPCPSGRIAHTQSLVTDLFVPDGRYDPLAIIETLVGAYTLPGDTVLDLQGRDGIAGICGDAGRRYTSDPEKPIDPETGPGEKRSVDTMSHVWSPGRYDGQATQLTADWESGEIIAIRRGGRRIGLLPVDRVPMHQFLKPGGNDKVAVGVNNGLSHFCGRGALPIAGCDRDCYSGDGCLGCYAQQQWPARWRHSRAAGYDVRLNGLHNDLGRIRIPKSDDWSLAGHPPVCDPPIWRNDCESSDGALSISLGLIQRYAIATPQHYFYTFCSHAFRPTDEALARLAALDNVWTLTTLSGWFSPAELDLRFAELERYLDFGIPSVAYVVTSSLWHNESIARRALKLLPPELLIEEPRRIHNNLQEPAQLNVNPLGRCSQTHCDECPLKCGFVALTAAGLLRAPAAVPAPIITGHWAEEREMITNVA